MVRSVCVILFLTFITVGMILVWSESLCAFLQLLQFWNLEKSSELCCYSYRNVIILKQLLSLISKLLKCMILKQGRLLKSGLLYSLKSHKKMQSRFM
ncbi:hypothetical protein ZIOFF_027154 [Zingiber officinale]|uniref:Uncharacterized protein n=1 Tax=Zingiber officinale TaxID=94328 RepID=A0A8J5H5X7_ZINOF|nr:hypothetical protein ZIOFF_027154 [Zingiber officinale]